MPQAHDRTPENAHPTDPNPIAEASGAPRVRVRRAANFRAFMITGALLGAVVGLIYGALSPMDDGYTASSAVLYCGAIAAILGVLLGAVVALVLDRRG